VGFQFRSGLAVLFALTAQAALELAAAQDAQILKTILFTGSSTNTTQPK